MSSIINGSSASIQIQSTEPQEHREGLRLPSDRPLTSNMKNKYTLKPLSRTIRAPLEALVKAWEEERKSETTVPLTHVDKKV